ncbi:MAG: protein kinase [Myxococcales bacterium]|nr:protein kinase [Myxococcales bacterium]
MTALPRRLGRYELFHELARGGMGVVYLARHRSVGGFSRLVAVKQCLPEHTRDRDFVAMFLDEARLAARVRHPSVVPTIDVEHERDVLFLAMEYVEGERLVDLIRAAYEQAGAVPLAIAVRVMIDALRGLHAAHSLEDSDGTPLALVHRDVSPQNIIVGYDGLARIIDFGVARAERRLARTMVGGLPKGKLAYMAPEQVLETGLDRRADVFAAGLVLWEVLTSRRLFDANVETALVAQVLEGPIVAPSRVRPDVPASLDQVVMTALDRDVSRRFSTALAFAEALERAGVTPASQDTVARFAQHVLADKRTQRLALQRRIEAMPPLPEADAPAPSRSATASPVPKTVAFDPTTHAPSAHGAPSPYAPPPQFGPMPTGATYGSHNATPHAHSASIVAPRESTSPLVYVAIGMVVIGVAFGAASVVARSRARRERLELAPIEVPPAIAILPAVGSDATDAPAPPTDAALQAATPDAGAGPARTPTPRRRRSRARPPEGVEF